MSVGAGRPLQPPPPNRQVVGFLSSKLSGPWHGWWNSVDGGGGAPMDVTVLVPAWMLVPLLLPVPAAAATGAPVWRRLSPGSRALQETSARVQTILTDCEAEARNIFV